MGKKSNKSRKRREKQNPAFLVGLNPFKNFQNKIQINKNKFAFFFVYGDVDLSSIEKKDGLFNLIFFFL